MIAGKLCPPFRTDSIFIHSRLHVEGTPDAFLSGVFGEEKALDNRSPFEILDDLRDVLHRNSVINDVVRIDHHVRPDIAEIDRATIVDQDFRVQALPDDCKA